MLTNCRFLNCTIRYTKSNPKYIYSAVKYDHINVSWAFERIRYFGRLSDYNEEDSHEMQEFQEVLDNIDSVDGIYDMQSQIQQVGILGSMYCIDGTSFTDALKL